MSLYQPPHFCVAERPVLVDLMRAHPLATLVSVADGIPQFTHLPLDVDDAPDGMRLLGHVARANPHWKHWAGGAAVTAIFHGPDGYVSPSWYSEREAVPTWNYAVVHVQGTVTVTHDADDKERILKTLIDRHDAAYRRQWDDLPEEYREKMKRGIVGLVISVEQLHGKFKLSQNRTIEDRRRVYAEMLGGEASARGLAGWMRRLGVVD
jgi:transcriptional regulator